MKAKKQKPDFLHLAENLLKWYGENGRDLPWRSTKNPYNIWICEILLQQTQVKQGLNHYLRFVEHFPDVKSLADAHEDEVLLYWKGLGYYSRALNLHKAARQIMTDFNGIFPNKHADILSLKGVGKYTAAAISSIAFNLKFPAIDGNFYRVLSRLFADSYDISNSGAFNYFAELALLMMPEKYFGDFNEAIMDLGSEVCRPKNPNCGICPFNIDCLAFNSGTIDQFPVKTKKVKVSDLDLTYYFINFEDQFLIKRRGDDFIWKKLFEFATEIPEDFLPYIRRSKVVAHKLTHKNLSITINNVLLPNFKLLQNFAEKMAFELVTIDEAKNKSFPKPLQNYLEKIKDKGGFQSEMF